jgi:hypothetical protein
MPKLKLNDQQTGAWIEDEEKTLGIISKELSPGSKTDYVCLYPAVNGKVSLNCYALCMIDGEVNLQVPLKNGKTYQLTGEKLAALLETIKI